MNMSKEADRAVDEIKRYKGKPFKDILASMRSEAKLHWENPTLFGDKSADLILVQALERLDDYTYQRCLPDTILRAVRHVEANKLHHPRKMLGISMDKAMLDVRNLTSKQMDQSDV